ncbi:cytoplasmic protein, partial [Bacillus cereus]|nr:cytoplasmic protein [Bacillus cereus]
SEVKFEGYKNSIEGNFAHNFKIWRNEFVKTIKNKAENNK